MKDIEKETPLQPPVEGTPICPHNPFLGHISPRVLQGDFDRVDDDVIGKGGFTRNVLRRIRIRPARRHPR